MKRIIKYFLLVILLLPIFVNAASKKTNYYSSVEIANKYINTFDKRDRYLILGSKIFGSDFGTNGGFITADEFRASLIGNSSYLSSGLDYWTQTNVGSNKYVVSFGLLQRDINLESGTRVVEYVKPDTKVKGNGTIPSPWEFVDVHLINIKKGVADDEVKIEVNPTSVLDGGSATVKITESQTHMYSGKDDCGLIYERSDGDFIKYYKTQELHRDLTCTANFSERKTIISYDCGEGATGSIPDATVLYGSKYTYAKTSLCGTRAGYSQNSDIWVDDGGFKKDSNNKNYKGTIDPWKNTATKLTLHRVYNDDELPKVTVTAYKYDSSKANHLGEVIQGSQTFNKNGTYKVNNAKWLNYHVVFRVETNDNEGISSITLKTNQVLKKNNQNTKYTSTARLAENHSTQYIEFKPDGSEDGYRQLQWVAIDGTNSKFVKTKSKTTVITLVALMDTIKPECTFDYANEKVTLKYSDSLSEVDTFGLSNSDDETYNKKKSLAQSVNTFYGIVKDKVGNVAKCNTNLISTIQDGFKKTTKECERGNDYYVQTTSTCGKTSNCVKAGSTRICVVNPPNSTTCAEGFSADTTKACKASGYDGALSTFYMGGGSNLHAYCCNYTYAYGSASNSNVASCSASSPSCSSSSHAGNKKVTCAGPYPTYEWSGTTTTAVQECIAKDFNCNSNNVVGATHVACAKNYICPPEAIGYTKANNSYCYK